MLVRSTVLGLTFGIGGVAHGFVLPAVSIDSTSGVVNSSGPASGSTDSDPTLAELFVDVAPDFFGGGTDYYSATVDGRASNNAQSNSNTFSADSYAFSRVLKQFETPAWGPIFSQIDSETEIEFTIPVDATVTLDGERFYSYSASHSEFGGLSQSNSNYESRMSISSSLSGSGAGGWNPSDINGFTSVSGNAPNPTVSKSFDINDNPSLIDINETLFLEAGTYTLTLNTSAISDKETNTIYDYAGTTAHAFIELDVTITLTGDFDGSGGNGVIDLSDADLLSSAIDSGSMDPKYDLDDSGTITLDDYTYLVEDIVQTNIGDANFDGFVNQTDLNSVLMNWGKTNADRIEGDLSGNRFVDQTDLNIVLTNWGYVAPLTSGPSSLPEPTSVAMLGILGLTGLRFRTK